MMGNATSTADRIEFQGLVRQICDHVEGIAADDLIELALMHGWCESIIQISRTDPESAAAGEQVKPIARLLEQLILGEAQDTKASLEQLTQEVRCLAQMCQVQPPVASADASSQSDSPSGFVAEDQDPAQSLAHFFDDTDSPTEVKKAEPAAAIGETVEAGVQESSEEDYESTPLLINEKEVEFLKGFVEEANEHIASIEAALLDVERVPDDKGKLDDLFRPFHTIKGMAGFLNLRDIGSLTHEVETLMDQARKGLRIVTPGLIDLVFEVVDLLKGQVGSVGAYLVAPNGEPVPQPPIVEMIRRLRGVVAGKLEPQGRGVSPASSNQQPVASDVSADRSESIPEVLVPSRSSAIDQALVSSAPEGPPAVLKVDAAARQSAGSGNAQAAAAPIASTDQSVRIDTNKLDALVDMVGELVIAQTQVGGSGVVQADALLNKNVNQVTKIVRTVQELVLAMRMIPIGSTFQKMARLVRDVSRKAGKTVELTISGEETELDKTVIQQIGDPLVHMVRNAVDHGVENPAQRLAAGKGEVGHVHLGASHQGGNILIEIRDDGGGLDPKKLISKAIEKGVIPPGTELPDQEAFELIFAPGFSTAETITDISGRGVGMDVVKRNIDQLRGKVEIVSELGKGTTFFIRLPLTLAIIDGMVVRIGQQRFIIPTITLEQALRPTAEQITTVQHRGEMIQVRGQLIPLIQLGELFGITSHLKPSESMVVIARSEGKSAGLVVEELLGQQQVVIKTLGEKFEALQGISGAAILGDGRVGLILEMSGLTQFNDTNNVTDRLRPLGKAVTRSPAAGGQAESGSENKAVEAVFATA